MKIEMMKVQQSFQKDICYGMGNTSFIDQNILKSDFFSQTISKHFPQKQLKVR